MTVANQFELQWDIASGFCAAGHFDLVIQLRGCGEIEHGAACARLRIGSAVHDARNARMHQRTDAPVMLSAQARRQLTGGLERVWTRFEQPTLAKADAA